INCSIKNDADIYFQFGGTDWVDTVGQERRVTWNDSVGSLDYDSAPAWKSRPYRCLAQYVEKVANVDGFAAVTGLTDAGDIDLTINFPSDVSLYDHVDVRRI